MKITPDELITLIGRIREEERGRASVILADNERDLIQKIGKLREDVKKIGLPDSSQIMMMLDYLDPRPSGPPGANAEYSEVMKKRYPTMFKGGPT